MWTVYLVKIDSKFYVGITSRGLKWRKLRHETDSRRKTTRTYFHNKLLKHMKNAEWSVLVEVATKDLAIALEKQYIIEYNSLYPSGYNLTKGGEGVWGHQHSKETIDKIKLANSGRKHSIKSKKLMSKNRKGVSTGSQSKERIDKKAVDMGSVAFDVFTKDGIYVGTWTNKSQCARDLQISRSTIIRQLENQSNYFNVKYVFRVKDV